jgi:hypothetical protein
MRVWLRAAGARRQYAPASAERQCALAGLVWPRRPAAQAHRYLRVILLPGGETVHNVFFDRGFVP